MPSKSRLLSSVVNKSESLIGASLSQPNEVNLQALETAATQYTDVTTLPASGYVGEQAFVASTNRLYIWTGTGWFNIALVNTDPTISSAGAANYTMSYGTPITVNVDASDPEGLGLSYSYYTSDSIGSIATITNDSSQFTITPSSDYSVEGSFGLVFRASDGPNIASSSSSTFTLTNQAPSLSGNSSSYVLAKDGSTPTVITLTSVDPEGQPITYTATGDSGFNAIATVSNDSSVFTIIPKSEDSAVSGTGSLTFTASDGVKSTNATSSFTLNFISIIENSNYTTLLATATGTSDNNNITDASTNNHSITVNGDAHAGTFSPYRSGGYSTYFDGSGDYLTATGTAIGTGNFTLEAWIYTASFSNYRTIFTNRGSSNSTGNFVLGVDSAAQVYLYSNNFLITSSSTLSANTWHHVALVRNGTGSGSTVLYIDGSSVGSADVSNNFSDTAYDIGGDTVDSYHWNGYISDLRVNIGTAVYTSTFTPPTERLTAITNTSLLTCHLPYIADGSTNNHSITVNGDVSTKPFSPYDYNEYSAADHGGSAYFVGGADYSSQYLSLSGPSMPSGDFTLSTWAYLTSAEDGITLIDFNGNSGGFRIVYMSHYGTPQNNAGYHFRFYTAGGTVYLYDHNINHHLNQWNYIVVVRDSGTFKLYVNNKLINTSTANPTFSSSTNVRIGQTFGGSGTLEGYLSDIIYNPTTAITDFTPPTAPLSSTGAELHIKGTDASIIDKSQGANLKLVGNVDNGWGLDKFITSQQAVEFNGSNQYLTVAGSSDFDFGLNDFTVEAWVYTDSSDEQVITSGRPSGSSWIFLNKMASNTIRILISTNGSSWAVNSTSTETMTLSRWNHISVSRDGSTINTYLNGRLIISTSISGSIHYDTSEKIAIGSGENDRADRAWNGYISDFRIINGTAVVPPVNGPNEALTEVTNTKLLTCRPSGASITDLSATGTTHTITSISSTAAAYASPFGKAMHFDGTGDYITNLPDDLFAFGYDPYTIEFWIYTASYPAYSGSYHIMGSSTSSGDKVVVKLNSQIAIGDCNGDTYTYGNSVYANMPTAGNWVHVAFVRTGILNNQCKCYINGTVSNSDIDNKNWGTATDNTIGATASGSYGFNGYIQDLRVTKGLARYTTNFTPPTASLEG
jgi:hypothetical protein